jgi:hypothetical protein
VRDTSETHRKTCRFLCDNFSAITTPFTGARCRACGRAIGEQGGAQSDDPLTGSSGWPCRSMPRTGVLVEVVSEAHEDVHGGI